jgi:tripartite-type tricarboxylate transporter receptor subunit TctC
MSPAYLLERSACKRSRAERTPGRPNRLVEHGVGLAPGGTGIIARTCARFLEAQVQAVVVGNRPGASGKIALGAVVRAAAGWTGAWRTNMPGLGAGPSGATQPAGALICARSVDSAG